MKRTDVPPVPSTQQHGEAALIEGGTGQYLLEHRLFALQHEGGKQSGFKSSHSSRWIVGDGRAGKSSW